MTILAIKPFAKIEHANLIVIRFARTQSKGDGGSSAFTLSNFLTFWVSERDFDGKFCGNQNIKSLLHENLKFSDGLNWQL